MANPGERIMRASCNEDSVFVELADGRTTRFGQGQLTRRWIRRRLASSGESESVVRR